MRQDIWDSIADTFELPRSVAPEDDGDFTVERITITPGCGGGHIGWNPSEETRRRMSESQKGRKSWNKGMRGVYKLGHTNENHIKVSAADKINIKDRKLSGESTKQIHKDYPQVTLGTFYNIVTNLWK